MGFELWAPGCSDGSGDLSLMDAFAICFGRCAFIVAPVAPDAPAAPAVAGCCEERKFLRKSILCCDCENMPSMLLLP